MLTARIPSQSDFTDRGTILSPGDCGAWDWWLGSISAVIKHDGTLYVYYFAADGDRTSGACNDAGDERNRYLGVATSTDNRTFSKSVSNPLIEHQPSGGTGAGLSGEGGVLLGGSPGVIDGKFILYFGGMEEISNEVVDSDIVYIESTNGITWTGQADVIDSDTIDRYADECFPVGAIKLNSTWHIYFTGQDGGADDWSLRHVSSSSPNSGFGTTSTKVSGPADGASKSAQGDIIQIGDKDILFVHHLDFWKGSFEVRTTTIGSMTSLSTLEDTWNWDAAAEAEQVGHGKLFLDRDVNEWLLIYRGVTPSGGSSADAEIKLKTAPVQYTSPVNPRKTPRRQPGRPY